MDLSRGLGICQDLHEGDSGLEILAEVKSEDSTRWVKCFMVEDT